ncbi:MAG: hypothetical protein RIC35_09610 [Marinoscillum sp.]
MKNHITYKLVIAVAMTVFSMNIAQAQIWGVGIYATYNSNTVGKVSYLMPADDTFSNLSPGISVEGCFDGKFYRANSEFFKEGTMKISSPDKSPRNGYGHTILNWEICWRIFRMGDHFSAGLGGAFLWRREGVNFPHFHEPGDEVIRGVFEGPTGNYLYGSGSYMVKHRAGIGPQAQIAFQNDDETISVRLAYTASTYGKKNLYTSTELSGYFKMADNSVIRVTARRYSKFLDVPDFYTDDYSGYQYDSNIPVLPHDAKIMTYELTIGYLIPSLIPGERYSVKSYTK